MAEIHVIHPATEPGLCRCGCGQRTKLSDRTNSKRGVVKGQPLPYARGHNANTGKKPPLLTSDPAKCWIWQGTIDASGYGRESIRGRQVLAHRVAYQRANGPIPDGLQLDHLCRNRACVNPAHLEPVTNAENTRRGAGTKLTREQVEEIRASDMSTIYLGKLHGVHNSQISRIRNHRKWVAA